MIIHCKAKIVKAKINWMWQKYPLEAIFEQIFVKKIFSKETKFEIKSRFFFVCEKANEKWKIALWFIKRGREKKKETIFLFYCSNSDCDGNDCAWNSLWNVDILSISRERKSDVNENGWKKYHLYLFDRSEFNFLRLSLKF